MLRAKVFKFKRGEGNMRRKLRDRVLTSTDLIGSLAGIPLVAQAMNAATQSKPLRKALQVVAEIDADAWLPTFHATPLRSRLTQKTWRVEGEPAGRTRGKMALFATCYINRNEPGIGEDFAAVYEHNGIPITVVEKERCCGMPKLELGDLESVVANKEINIPQLAKWVDEGWDLTALVPSCVLMFKQELPLLFPDDADVQKVKNAFYDPFEYLMLRHKEGKLKTDFKQGLGKVAYHVACHQRVQNIGLKTRDVLALVPDTVIEVIERCSGHDGTYAVKHESHAFAMKIVKPVVTRVQQAKADHYGSDCPMAAHHIEHALHDGHAPQHPMTLLRKAYAI
jgi:Fe-S oxidoreductase